MVICWDKKSFGENHHLYPRIFMLYHKKSITKLCGSVPESITLNCSLGLCGWPSKSTRSPRESFKFSQGYLSDDRISERI